MVRRGGLRNSYCSSSSTDEPPCGCESSAMGTPHDTLGLSPMVGGKHHTSICPNETVLCTILLPRILLLLLAGVVLLCGEDETEAEDEDAAEETEQDDSSSSSSSDAEA